MDAETKAEFRIIRERDAETSKLIRAFIEEVRAKHEKDHLFHFGNDGRGGLNGVVMEHQAAIERLQRERDEAEEEMEKRLDARREEAQRKQGWLMSIISSVVAAVVSAAIILTLGLQ